MMIPAHAINRSRLLEISLAFVRKQRAAVLLVPLVTGHPF
jgi:hypothetical protein